MKNKKVLTLLLGLTLMLSIAACGNQETDKKDNNKKTDEVVQSELEGNEEDVEAGEEVENTEDNTQSEAPENAQGDNMQPTVAKTIMYAKSNVNVRSGAGTSNAKVGSLTKGQEVTKVDEENGWSKIEFNGTTGYVSSKYLSAEKVSASTANSSTGNSNGNNSTKPSTGTPAGTPTETKPSITECEHWYQPEFKSCEHLKQMVWACNGCGYPLFTIESGKPVNFANMYSHPAYYSEKLGFDCTGGGYHSEMFNRGFCAICHDEVIYRHCMFSETGKMCIKNEALGTYEKVEVGEVSAFWKSCSCGRNMLMLGQVTPESAYGGVLITKETCCYCGDVKNYPQK